MAEAQNPLTGKVKKLAAILGAAKEAGKKVKEEEAKARQAETGQSSPQA